MKRLRLALVSLLLLLAGYTGLTACATTEILFAELDARYALPSSQRFVVEPGLDIHYTDEGNAAGPAIIMVHGFAASVHAWRPWIERMADHYRLIALDLPGHGLTRAPENYRASLDANVELVERLRDHLELDSFIIVGNSMGGAVSWNYALAHPGRLRAMVLVDAAGWPGDRDQSGGPPVIFRLINNPAGRAILKAFDPRMFAKGGLESAYLDRELVTEELIDRYADLALAPGHRDILLTQNSRPQRPVSASDFAGILVPTLVMSGEQDNIIPVEDSRAMAAAMPKAVLITYPDGGHVPMEQLPELSARDFRSFLEGLQD